VDEASGVTNHIEPEWAIVSVLFADIRCYTPFAERATAREAVDHLNAFFDVVIPVVEAHAGYVHQLLGDGLLAMFGAPAPTPTDHADRALAAGAQMLDAIDKQLGDRCRIGVGINTGFVLVGTIGGGGQRQLGFVGDPVNVAARVQGATREIGEDLLITEATRCLLEAGGAALRSLGTLSPKGKAKPVTVHGVARNDSGASSSCNGQPMSVLTRSVYALGSGICAARARHGAPVAGGGSTGVVVRGLPRVRGLASARGLPAADRLAGDEQGRRPAPARGRGPSRPAGARHDVHARVRPGADLAGRGSRRERYLGGLLIAGPPISCRMTAV